LVRTVGLPPVRPWVGFERWLSGAWTASRCSALFHLIKHGKLSILDWGHFVQEIRP
jgi:hypothetical protein